MEKSQSSVWAYNHNPMQWTRSERNRERLDLDLDWVEFSIRTLDNLIVFIKNEVTSHVSILGFRLGRL